MHRCTKRCGFGTTQPVEFLKHIQTCPTVAQWIGEWARRMMQFPDWRERVGLEARRG